jgi:hypothetical protein
MSSSFVAVSTLAKLGRKQRGTVRFQQYTGVRVNKFQEQVRARLRERTPNFSKLAEWTNVDRTTISNRLREGGTALCLDWLDEVRSFYQMSVAEMVREPGAAFQSVSPLESSLLDRFRKMTEAQRLSLMNVLDWRPEVLSRQKRGPRYLGDEALVVSLYNDVPADVQAAVLQLMRDHPAVKARHHLKR